MRVAKNDTSEPASISRRLETDSRRAVLETIPDCGRFVTEDQPDLVNERLAKFLA